jgi:hypothetical protein
MQRLDYSPAFPGLPRGLRYAILVVSIIALLAATGVAAGIWWIAHSMSAKVATFDAKTSQAKLIGLTPPQIIALLGNPIVNQSDAIAYEDSTGEICRIEITNGVATGVEHYMK